MTKGEIKEIFRLKKQIDKMYQSCRGKYEDLYYHYQGKTYIKTVPVSLKLYANIMREFPEDKPLDPEARPVLFACAKCGDMPDLLMTSTIDKNKKIDLGKVLIDSEMRDAGISEKERKQWLDALTIGN